MTVFIVVLVIVLLFSFAAGAAIAKKTKATQERVDSRYKLDERFVSPVDQAVLGLNFSEEIILLGNGRSERKHSFSDIVSVEVQENDTTVTNTNRGSQLMGAVAGGLLLGAGGALVGGLSGSTRSRVRIRGLALKIVVDNLATPNYTIWFFKTDDEKGMSPDSVFVKPQIEQLERMHAQLLNAMRRADQKSAQYSHQRVVPQANHVDALGKLWEMKQAGALTDAEFAAQKSILLGGGSPAAPLLSPAQISEPTCEVVVTGYRNKIHAIKAVRMVLGVGLAEAVRLLDSLPATLTQGVTKSEALNMAASLRAHADIDLLEP